MATHDPVPAVVLVFAMVVLITVALVVAQAARGDRADDQRPIPQDP